jgi:hypothetical protein
MNRYRVRCRFRELPPLSFAVEAADPADAVATARLSFSARGLAQLTRIDARPERRRIRLPSFTGFLAAQFAEAHNTGH